METTNSNSSNQNQNSSSSENLNQKTQITIFSITTCPHCKKAKNLLQSLDLSYVDISLTSYPSKRTDMIKLSDRLTVPQIFIHNDHIGGASELSELNQKGKLIETVQSKKTSTEPLDPRLQIPDIEPVKPFDINILNNPMDHENIEIAGNNYTHWEIRDILKKEVDIQDRSYHFKTYKKCFIGNQFVDFLLKKFQFKSREDCVQLGKQLLALGFFHHVVREHDFKDDHLFYRLHGDEEDTILNRFKQYPKGTELKLCPFDLIQGIKQKFQDIKDFYVDDKDGLVDYTLLQSHKDWNNFLESFSDLQLVDMGKMSENQRLAFIINVYNTTILIAFAIVGVPKTTFQRYRFFDNYTIDIGGLLYSFNELESGLLRKNQKAPGHFSKHFKDNDPRCQYIIQNFDNRIHFALNCGSKSCPPVKKFTPDAVKEELRINSQAFCEDDENVRVDLEKKHLYLNRIFDWYSGDFGSDDKQRIDFICTLLRGQKQKDLQSLIDSGNKIKIKLLTYDWSNDSK